jgi:hypothetical protein
MSGEPFIEESKTPTARLNSGFLHQSKENIISIFDRNEIAHQQRKPRTASGSYFEMDSGGVAVGMRHVECSELRPVVASPVSPVSIVSDPCQCHAGSAIRSPACANSTPARKHQRHGG